MSSSDRNLWKANSCTRSDTASKDSGGGHAGAWPWQGYLMDEDDDFFCGATIINKQWMMTSGECVYEKHMNSEPIYAVVGEVDILYDADRTSVLVKAHLHPNYNPFEKDYDIALLQLVEEIEYSDYIQPACIVTSNDTADDRLTTGEYCVITGWGQTHKSDSISASSFLRQTRIPIIDQDVCKKISSPPNDFSRDRMFCSGDLATGGVDGCDGDSGGPLVCFRNNVWRQFGIVTHLLGCGSPGTPSYYTKVSYYGQWIVDLISSLTNTTIPTPVPSTTKISSTQSTWSASSTAAPVNTQTTVGSVISSLTSTTVPTPFPSTTKISSTQITWSASSTAVPVNTQTKVGSGTTDSLSTNANSTTIDETNNTVPVTTQTFTKPPTQGTTSSVASNAANTVFIMLVMCCTQLANGFI